MVYNSSGTNSARILIVAPNTQSADALNKILEPTGWKTHTAVGVEEAFAALRTQAVDAVLTEMKLSEVNGSQLVQAAFRIHPQLTALILVGPGESTTARSAVASGICELISSDADPEFVIMAVERLLARREAARRALWKDTKDVLIHLLKAIAAAIDARIEFAAMHSRRVAQICLQVTPEMELSEYEARTLELAAHVHDFGKIGTPDDVLSKPGSLNDEEWVDVLKHPAFGSVMFAEIEELADVAAAIRHHHEHYDGSGYPDGLIGEAAPKLARILAVADAYEAMTSPRPYRDALSHAEAMEEIRQHAGRQFDPWVVERFVEAMADSAVQNRKLAA